MSQAGELNVVENNPDIPTSFITNSGTAVPIANELEILGTSIPAGATPVHTTGASNVVTIEVQTSQAIASTNAANIGLAAFDSADFTVDANGFVSLVGAAGGIQVLDGNTGSATGTTVTIHTPASTGTMNFSGVASTLTLNLIDGSGNFAVGNSPSVTGNNNVAIGNGASVAGSGVAIGQTANSGSIDNISIGNGSSATGSLSTAIGHNASDGGFNHDLVVGDSATTSGAQAAAVGYTASAAGGSAAFGAFASATGVNSTALGNSSTDTGGLSSVIVGADAVGGSGGTNIVIGKSAGNTNTTGASNITIGNVGSVGESNVIRIGTQGSGAGQQNTCFIAGIEGVTVSTPQIVTINPSTGQLGSQPTSPSVLHVTIVTTSPYVVLPTDQFLAVDTTSIAITVELPNAPATGTVFYIKDYLGNAATHNISVTTVGGVVTIDGVTTYTINTNYMSISVIFNGTNYNVF